MFSQLNPVSKTLRFRMIPMLETLSNFQKFNILQKEEERFRNYKELKPYLSAYHANIFEQAFASIKSKKDLDLEALAMRYKAYIDSLGTDDEPKCEKNYIGELEKCNRILEKEVKATPLYKSQPGEGQKDGIDVFAAKFFSEGCDMFPSWVRAQYPDEPEKAERAVELFRSFSRFPSYFRGFNEAKAKVLYCFDLNKRSGEGKKGSVIQRVFEDNFTVYLKNSECMAQIGVDHPEIIEMLEKEFEGIYDAEYIREVSTVKGFFLCMADTDIDWYNQLLSGYANNDKTKVRGLNELINEWNQHHEAHDHIRTKPAKLKKVLNLGNNTLSWIPVKLESDKQLAETLREMQDKNIAQVDGGRYQGSAPAVLAQLIASVNEENADKVYIKDECIHILSKLNTGSFNTYRKFIETFAERTFTGTTRKAEKEREQFLSKDCFSIGQLVSVLKGGMPEDEDAGENELTPQVFLQGLLDELTGLDKNIPAYCYAAETSIGASSDLTSDNQAKQDIKAYLDEVNRISHIHSYFDIAHRERYATDDDFYEVLDRLAEVSTDSIYRVYNMMRNYLTRTPQERDDKVKFKLTLDSPTLGEGWDCDKENDRNSTLLSDGKYTYLLVLNNSKDLMSKFGLPKKPKMSDLLQPGGERIQKMVYKQFTGAMKMLPKVFFSGNMPAKHGVDSVFMEKYKAKCHTKGDTFDPAFVAEYVDKCKELMAKREEWKLFNFKFKPTEEYTTVDLFYRDIEDQGYTIQFVDANYDVIKKWVKEGSAFLFKLWNKDYADKAGGRENLHTIYWKALFSPENAQMRSVRLCGGAELFYRPQVIDPKGAIRHAEGSVLVNKVADDGTPVPPQVYAHLKAYYNGRPVELDDEDRAFLPKVKHRKATYDIVKDRHYTHENFYLHVPVIFNKTASQRGFNLNVEFIRRLALQPDTNIMSIRRGRENLLYCAVIDRKGNLVAARSYNVLHEQTRKGDIDYAAKLRQLHEQRVDSRRSWTELDSIKNVKNGYLSVAIGEIVSDLRKYNAVLVLESVSDSFRDKMSAFEDTLYKGFETALLSKLNYLVYKVDMDGKPMNPSAPGGVLNGLQFTMGKELSKFPYQNGGVFFVSPSYTAEVDLQTGYYNMLAGTNAKKMSNKQLHEFLGSFDFIGYDEEERAFKLVLNWSRISLTSSRKGVLDKAFTLYADDRERSVYNFQAEGKLRHRTCTPYSELVRLLKTRDIAYKDGKNLTSILSTVKLLKNELVEIVNIILGVISLKYYPHGDRIFLSSVRDEEGNYMTADDPDCVSAMCVGFKLLYLLYNRFMPALSSGKTDRIDRSVSIEDWLGFIQDWKRKI